MPGNATKGAFKAGGADNNRTNGESQLLRAGVQRAASPLCLGAGTAAHCWGQGARPIGGLRAASPIGSRVKRLAQGELMPCVNSYWVLPDAEIRRFGGFAAAPPSGKISRDWRDGI
ncbi:hypothetical protein [Anaerotignum lactatifermentans]|nr:hypothetical protein [Anaerotignum lactatifermentans]